MEKQNRIKRSLRVSFIDGVFAAGMAGFTTDYITPYALFLRAEVFEIGLLSALPNLLSSLVQLKSPDLADKFKSRKKIINFFVLLHALMLIPVIFLPFLFKQNAVKFLIIFVTLFMGLNAIANPAWASLMSDHIPFKKRGTYFGWRSKILGIITLTSMFLAGYILHYFKHDVLKGFIIIFTIAFISRLISWYFLTLMYEPLLKIKKEDYFSIWDFITRIKKSDFGKFVVFVGLLNFAVNIASPFFSVFLLRELKYSYLTYTIIMTTVAITTIFTIVRWGKNADKFGNIKILKVTSLFISILPLLWLISHNPIFLVFVQTISGFAWSGFNLCAVNFIYDAVKPEKRTRCIAYFNVFAGLAICLGSLCGGFLVDFLPKINGFKFLSLFLLSGILRLIVVLFFFNKIKEVRQVEKISSYELFYSVTGIRPILDISRQIREMLIGED